jgi:hypothetical protein
MKDPLAPFGRCVMCDCGLWSAPNFYFGTGPLCWGCWSKLKRGTAAIPDKPKRPTLWQQFLRMWAR